MRKKEYFISLKLPQNLEKLEEIAYNLRWSYNKKAQELFKIIDPELWEKTNNSPVEMLMNLTTEKIEKISKDPFFIAHLNEVYEDLENYKKSLRWFYTNYNKNNGYKDILVAYFSAEYGIHESLHLYSGGLGILSADHCKAASYIGLPLVAVGLLYRNGYFHQYLNTDGWQQEYYPYNEFYKMPFKTVKNVDGKDMIITIEAPTPIYVKLWESYIGNIRLILLDTDIEENTPENRVITGQLYGGDSNLRLRQEIVLGIGGVRALASMQIKPTVYHINEGHPSFVLLERLRVLTSDHNLNLQEAIEVVKKSSLFTTHTPVAAGFDVFSYEQLNNHINPIIGNSNIKLEDIMRLGRFNENNPSEPFSMAVFAIKLSNYRNAVSKLHGKVSRKMFKPLWPKAIEKFAPIGHIVNGVHLATWISDEFQNLYNRYLGERWILQLYDKSVWEYTPNIPDIELYNARLRVKAQMLAFIRKRLWKQAKAKGASTSELIRIRDLLDHNAMTIGFARRFATYKRAYLLFMNEERLSKILNNEDMPVQIIIAGKAHPKDEAGKNILKQIMHTIRKPEFKDKIVFIEDYDIEVAKNIVKGVDIWLNTPRRPMEACGTSGMKVAANGGINFSILDGWWDQAYDGTNGWAIGFGETYDEESYQDRVESEEIYDKLENEIVPLFYSKDKIGIPREWIKIIKNSIKTIMPNFNTARMLIEYINKYYINLHKTSTDMSSNNYQKTKEFVQWLNTIKDKWASLKFIKTTEESDTFSLGGQITYRATIEVNDINPKDVAVYVITEFNPTLGYENALYDELKLINSSDGVAEYALNKRLDAAGRLEVSYLAFPKHPYIPNLFEYNLVATNA
ncbi:MAG: alpha-glucan family phosphorylase [Deferribacterota bacterium]|nr:alpha-glucan family phosphorylase [Deferribacterota bacterium]